MLVSIWNTVCLQFLFARCFFFALFKYIGYKIPINLHHHNIKLNGIHVSYYSSVQRLTLWFQFPILNSAEAFQEFFVVFEETFNKRNEGSRCKGHGFVSICENLWEGITGRAFYLVYVVQQICKRDVALYLCGEVIQFVKCILLIPFI